LRERETHTYREREKERGGEEEERKREGGRQGERKRKREKHRDRISERVGDGCQLYISLELSSEHQSATLLHFPTTTLSNRLGHTDPAERLAYVSTNGYMFKISASKPGSPIAAPKVTLVRSRRSPTDRAAGAPGTNHTTQKPTRFFGQPGRSWLRG
jgi:hypothetical protein